jgi:hypothetical protein
MDDYFKIVAAGPAFFVSAWLLMIFAGIAGADVGIRPFGYPTAMVVTIALWLTVAPAIGAIARTGRPKKGLSLAIRCGQRRSPSRCRRCRRDSSGGPAAAPSPSVTAPPPEEDRPMISVPPEASATRRAMLRPRPVDPPLD